VVKLRATTETSVPEQHHAAAMLHAVDALLP